MALVIASSGALRAMDVTVKGSSNRDRLTQETSSRFGGYTENNTYDSAGNPTTFRNATSIGYNGNNQRTGTGYTYDGNGNPTTYRGTSATFDEENRMLTANVSGSYSYGYRSDVPTAEAECELILREMELLRGRLQHDRSH